MNNEPEPGMGFLPTVSSPKKRIAPDVVPNPSPASVVNNYYFSIDPNALRDALFWAAIYAIIFVLAVAVLKYLLRA